jgi:ferric-dicitrate binding protein FerR (iron transport regulator)
MHKNDEYIETLLLNFINKSLTDEEEIILRSWLSESGDNRSKARSFCEFYHHIDAYTLLENVDSEVAFDKVVGEIHGFRASKSIPYLRIIQRVAALLFIPLLLVQLYQWNNHRHEASTWITMRTNPGMVSSIRLPDSSTVWLNANSTISYPQKFDKERMVKLDGEAFFDVTKNSAMRFKVQTPSTAAIEVLGTRFNVDAYRTDSTIRTTLEEGSVKFNYQTHNESRSLVLKPSQTVVYNVKSRSIVPNDLNEKTLTSWKDNQIILQNTTLVELLTIISRRFNVKFILKSDRLNEERFTGVFDNQQLITVLEHINISSRIKYRILNDGGKADGSITVELYK